ncbi:MAG: hypothetical protein AAGA09_05985 [Pseudomonadota bacterium]
MTDKKSSSRGRLKRAAAKIAPSIAHALGGPLAGAAVEQLSRVIFGAPDASEDDIAAALAAATPEQLLALRSADYAFREALREADIEERRIDAEDRADARARQIAMNDWTVTALGALVLAGFFLVLGAMLTHQLPAGAETEFSIMLGALATMTAAVVNYFFGSSTGSKEKTRLFALRGRRADEHENA